MILQGKFKEEKIIPWKNGKGQDRIFVIEEDSGFKQSLNVSNDFTLPKVDEKVSYNVGIKPYHFENKQIKKSYLRVWAMLPSKK